MIDAESLERAIRADGRYPPEAFLFLQRGLEFVVNAVHGRGEHAEGPSHVTGRQLCEGLRFLALQQWGPLAPTVLAQWNVHRTRDFGEMVFFLVSLGVMGRQDTDLIEDFDDVYDFSTAFSDYEIALETESPERAGPT